MQNDDLQFLGALKSRLRIWQLGLAVIELLRVLGLAIVCLAAYAFLDFFLAFPQPALVGIDVAIVAVLLVILGSRLVGVLLLSARDMAGMADRLLGNRRQPVLSAFELRRFLAGAESEWGNFLIRRSLDEARGALSKLAPGACLPRRPLALRLRTFAIQALIAGVVLGVPATANRVILSRIFFPWRDIPPYSPLKFALTPDQPAVLYGRTLELGVEITGGAVREPVLLLTRKGSSRHAAACFQESSSRFTQRLEKVVDPIEFCFATGRARSPWRRVELRLQPQIELSKLVITPPAYTRLPRRELIVGNEEITGFQGSSAELLVTSNRPLDGGEMIFRAPDGLGPGPSVKGTPRGTHTLSFSWNMKETARLEVRVWDVRHTPAPEPLVLNQKILPDAPPSVTMEEPAVFALATPHSVVPVALSASDDVGLREVGLVRTVTGFRDRVRALDLAETGKDFKWGGKLEMTSLGVDPGETLEFYVEARDTNPELTGINTSDVVKIQIISEMEYAKLLRDRITIEEFQARYQLVAEKFRAFIEALQNLKEELAKTGGDSAKAAEQLKAAQDALKEAIPLFDRLAKDFPVYDMEKRLGSVLKENAERMGQAQKDLGSSKPGDPGLGDKVDQMLKEFGAAEKKIQKEAADAAEVAAVAKVMRNAARFKQLVNQQKEVVRKLKRIEAAGRADPGGMRQAGGLQERTREELTNLAKALAESAQQLPNKPAYDVLRQTAKEFSEGIDENKIPELMEEGGTAAKNQDTAKARQSAELALEALESMLSKGGGGGMCEGKMKFQVGEDIGSTIRQMMECLFSLGKPGGNPGGGKGSSPGDGDADDGYSTDGYSPMNTPVFGPDRTFFGNEGQGNTGEGRGRTGASDAALKAAPREKTSGPDEKETTGENRPSEPAPEKYRDALKKYFQNESK